MCLVVSSLKLGNIVYLSECLLIYRYQFQVDSWNIKTEKTTIIVGNRILVRPCLIESCYKIDIFSNMLSSIIVTVLLSTPSHVKYLFSQK